MKKTILLLVLLVLASCGTSDTKKLQANLNVGFEGLELEFTKNAPPPTVFEQSSFPIQMKIRNAGSYSIKDPAAYMAISLEKLYVPSFNLESSSQAQKITENEISFVVDGKSEINPNGDQSIIILEAKTGKLEQQSESKLSSVAATMCYPYKTTLSTTVCIDPDVIGMRQGKKACEVDALPFPNGQGAPVAVTRIESYMLTEEDGTGLSIRPQFLIFLENKGDGNPVNINNYANLCKSSSAGGGDFWNIAYLKAFASGNTPLECKPGQDDTDPTLGKIQFRDKKDYVRCKFTTTIPKNSDAYTSPLRIEINYGYVETTTASFNIQRPYR